MKYSKEIVICLVLTMLINILYPSVYTKGEVPYVSAKCAIAMDAKTKIPLYEKNSEMLVPIASTTKIMTALVALKYGNLDNKVEISQRAASINGSTVGYRKGENIALRELLYGLMLRSGNDAAIAIAEGISGSVEEFVKLMNEYSLEIGLTNTHFETPHGLDRPTHYSTAYDLAVATAEARQNKEFNDIVASKDIDGKDYEFTRSYHNINKILWQIPEATGVKTGSTGLAGKCLVTSVNVKGHDVIIVVLNCNERWRETKKIYDYVVNNYDYEKFFVKGDIIDEILVNSKKLKLICDDDIIIPVNKNSGYEKEIIKPVKVRYDVQAGDSIGKVNIKKNGNIIYTKNLIAGNSVKVKRNIFNLFKHQH